MYILTNDTRKMHNEKIFYLNEKHHFIKDTRQFEIARLSQMALSATDIKAFIGEILRSVTNLLHTEYVKILQLTEDHKRLKLIEGVGWKKGTVGNAYVEVDFSSQAGYTLIKNKPVVVTDFKDEHRFEAPPLLKDHSVASGISVTIYGKNNPFGILGAHSKRKIKFSEDDVNFLHSVAYILSSVLILNDSVTKLKEEEEKYRILMEYASDGILIINPKGQILNANTKMCQISHYAKEELLTKHIREFFSAEMMKENQRVLDLITNDLELTIERNLIRKDGQEIVVEISVKLLPNNEIQGIFRDITQRRESEVMLRNIQKMEAIGRVSSGLTHDFNNYLSLINGYTDKLLSTQHIKDNECVTDIQKIKEIADKASGVTRSFLSYGNRTLDSKTIINVKELIEQSKESFLSLLGNSISIEYEISEKVYNIQANQDRLLQSLINLLTNSKDAVDEDGIIKIHVYNTELKEKYTNHAFNADVGNYLAISVHDNGSGMSNVVKTHFFEPFYTTKESTRGSGLGLSSIYVFIKELNGCITIESEVDNFTTITLFIPAFDSY